MQLSLAFLLLLSAAHAAISANSTEPIEHRRAVNYLTVNTVIPTAGFLINLRSFDDTNRVVKVTSNQKLAMTDNLARMATFKLTKRGTKWALQEYNSGLYVSAEEAGKKSLRATRSEARSWELFNPVSVGGADNVFALASETNGKMITVTPHNTLIAKTSSSDPVSGLHINFQLAIVTPPQVLDASAIALIGVVGGNNINEVDDIAYPLALPFPVTLYGQTSSNLTVSSNGWLSLSTITLPVGDSTFSPRQLPSANTFSTLPMLFPLWQDLYYYRNTAQGLFYQTKGTAPNRVFNIEYYASQYGSSTQYYHILVTFYENRPGSFRFTYYTISDSGSRGTVGAQCYGCANRPFTQYSYQQTRITDTLVIEYNPNTNTFVPVSP